MAAPAMSYTARDPESKLEATRGPEMVESSPAEKTAVDPNALSSAREEPLVKRFLEVFKGDIAQVKPPRGESQ